MSLFADYNLPFAIALGVMLLFGHLQIIGLTSASLGDMVKGATEDQGAAQFAPAP